VNSSIRDHPLVDQGYGWWVYERTVETDDFPLVPEQSEPMLDKTGTYNTETVYRYVDVCVERGQIVTRLLDGTQVPIEQVRLSEPVNLKHAIE
jgi:hypothetical protein